MRVVGAKKLMTLACQAEGREAIVGRRGGKSRVRQRAPSALSVFFLVSVECVNDLSIWEGRLFSLSLCGQ